MVRLLSLVALVFGLGFIGCEAPPPPRESGQIFKEEAPAGLLVVGIDLTGSYAERIDLAYRYIAQALERYLKSRHGENVRIVIFQISGAGSTPTLFDGGPASFREKFSSLVAFKKYLKENAKAAGSMVYASVADALGYVLWNYPDGKKTSTFTLIFSDLEDNDPKGAETMIQMSNALVGYGNRGGALAFFWVMHKTEDFWSKKLKAAGIKHSLVVPWVKIDPELPDWDD